MHCERIYVNLDTATQQEGMISKDTNSKWNHLLLVMYSCVGNLGNKCHLLDNIKCHVL